MHPAQMHPVRWPSRRRRVAEWILGAALCTMLCTVPTSYALALDLVLTDENNVSIGTEITGELLVRTCSTVSVTIIAENTPWSNNNWIGWTTPGMRDQNTIFRPSLGAGATGSAATGLTFGLFLLNDVDGGAGNTDSVYTTPDDAFLFSEHALSLPDPPNADTIWFRMFDVRGLGFQEYRWHDGDGNVNSFSGDYDIVLFADDDHTSPNFDYDDFMAGMSCARPQQACDFNSPPVCDNVDDASYFQCAPTSVCIPVGATDPDGNLSGCAVVGGPGVVTAGNWCYTPTAAGSFDVTIRCTDDCGAYCEESFQVSFAFGTAPEITCAGDVVVDCPADAPPCDPSSASVTGGAGTVVVTCARTDNGGNGCPASPLVYTDTYTATDSCGNTSTCQRTITIIDDEAPQVTCPTFPAVDFDCVSQVPACDASAASALDNCDGPVAVTCTRSDNGGSGCSADPLIITDTYSAVDDCGNVANCTVQFTVVDDMPPSISCPTYPAVLFDCVSEVPACNPLAATASDNCDPTVSIACSRSDNGGLGCSSDPLIITDTYVAMDDCGNSATCEVVFTVADITAPAIVCPPDFSVANIGDVPPCDPNDASASDNCGVVTVSCSDGPLIGSGCGGTITRTYTAVDACGNTSSCDQVITIDVGTPLSILCPPDMAVECIEDVPLCNPADATTSGGCGAITVTCSDGPLGGGACGGTITRTFVATDGEGNTASCDQLFTIDDVTPPSITCPPDFAVECVGDIPDCDPGEAIVSDNCEGAVTVSCSDSPLTGDGCGGTVTRTFVATDACGNSASCSQTITVDDTTPPSLSCLPDVTVQRFQDLPPCGGDDVSATDNCGIASITCTRTGAGGIGCTDDPVPVTYTWTVTDECGNSASCSRVVTVLRPDCPFAVSAGNGSEVIDAFSGQQLTVPINADEMSTEIGAFDLAVRYDKSAVTVYGVDRGAAVAAWEYFTYRLETSTDGSGVIRLIGIADLNDGVTPSYEAFMPVGVLANVRMSVNSDPAYIGRSFSLDPCLNGCTDNTVVTRDGAKTITMEEANFDECASALSGTVVPGVKFASMRLEVTEPTSTVGDINLNGMGYEVGDVVVLANYLVNGTSALSADPTLRDLQMAASDANNDGVILTVADLRFLLRVVSGSATPNFGAKLSPYANMGQTHYSVDNGRLVVSTDATVDLGGAHFIFRYSGMSVGSPTLSDAASQMTIRANGESGELRILVSTTANDMASVNAGRRELFTAPVTGDGSLELVEVQMSDADGALLLSSAYKSVVPTDYALEQNYPNPFNAGTVIPFALKDASEWTVTIYNVMGQTVRSFAGRNEAGRVMVPWDGNDETGATVSSGVYFYRVETANWHATKKMTLVK